MRDLTNENDTEWDSILALSTRFVNSQVNNTTGYLPFYLLYGYVSSNSFERKIQANCDFNENDNNDISLHIAREDAKNRILIQEEKWKRLKDSSHQKPNLKTCD
jgi:hypothetical protein